MLLTQLQWRYATPRFDPSRTIPTTTWAVLEKALAHPPSFFAFPPWRALIVRDPQLRLTLTGYTTGQPQPTECSHFVVFARNRVMTAGGVANFVGRATNGHGRAKGLRRGYGDGPVDDVVRDPHGAWIEEWTARQTYIALGSLLTSAARLGVDTCPMQGIDPTSYDEVLGLRGIGYSAVCACALGYREMEVKMAAGRKVCRDCSGGGRAALTGARAEGRGGLEFKE